MDNLETTFALTSWFSPARMSRYHSYNNPGQMYEWDVRLSKAFLEDIEHLEVLLRNFISSRLAAQSLRECDDERWFDHPELFNLNQRFVASVEKAKRRIHSEGHSDTADRVIAALTFDTWRYLLVGRLEPTVWRAIRSRANGGTPHAPALSRRDFERHVANIYWLRNRCSHQEPLVLNDYAAEKARIERMQASIAWVASAVDPAAAQWITHNSRVRQVRALCPRAIPLASTNTGIALRQIDDSNVLDVIGLDVDQEQQEFVAPNAVSLAEAFAAQQSGGVAAPFSLCHGETPVGFLMIGYDCIGWEGAPSLAKRSYVIWRLMIDHRFQGKGYGRAGLELALDYAQKQPCGNAKHVWLSCHKHNTTALNLYESVGFVDTGETDGDEIVLAKNL